MKKISLKSVLAFSVVIAGVLASFVGCKKEKVNPNSNSSIIENDNKVGEPGFWYVTWDEWGRKSKNCDGWGLCNFRAEYVLYDTLFDKGVSSDMHYSQIYSQNKSLSYFDIPYVSQYDNLVENASKTFYIDEDIYDIKNGYVFRIPAGEYSLVSDISDKNKYHIPIEITKTE